MLYLVRKVGEAIIVNNDVKITVVEVKRNSVKLGIVFPPGSSVLREEIYLRISEENEKAASSLEAVNDDDHLSTKLPSVVKSKT